MKTHVLKFAVDFVYLLASFLAAVSNEKELERATKQRTPK